MTRAKQATHSPSLGRVPWSACLRRGSGLFVLVGAWLAVSHPISGQSVDPASVLPSTLRWRAIGPNLGGRSIAAAGSVKRPNEYYFGAVGGGLWKTTDGGTTWNPVSDGSFKSASVGSVGICEQDPDVVYVGMGEGQWRGTMDAGDGAYGTRDGGKTWKFLGLAPETGQTAIPRMRVHPRDCNLVYAAVLGDPYGPNETRGVYRSRDGGATWQRILFRNNLAGASDLMLDPSQPSTIYATIWDAQRPIWGGRTHFTSGLFKSVDGGDTWEELTHRPGMPTVPIGKTAISVSGANPNRVYANIEAAPGDGGVYRSDDGGATWMKVNGHNELFHRADYYIRIVADPQDPDVVHVLDKSWFKSSDGGRTYVEMHPSHGDNHDLWIAPDDTRRMIQANDGGASVSLNSGETWTDLDIPTAQVYGIVITNDYPYLVCGAQQDNSSKCVPSEGTGDFFYEGSGGEQGHIAQHPVITPVGYGGSQRGGITMFDRATGQRKEIDVWPRQTDGWPASTMRERFQWTFPIIMSPHDPEVLYVTSQYVWKTSDRGMHWEKISPDLTRADPETLRGSDFPIKDYLGGDTYATIFSMAVSPLDPGILWAGSDDGLIHVTRDGGGNWEDVTPPDLPKYARTALIAASPHAPGKAYLASHRYFLQDLNPYIWVTEDFGKSWKKIVDGIPVGDYLHSVTEDPIRPGLLYAGTEHGAYVSFDDGAHWSSLSLNLPDLPITDVEVAHGNDLVTATFGRGFWILEGGATLIRQLRPEALGTGLHLFDPVDVVRSQSGPANGVDAAIAGRTRAPNSNRADIYYYLGQPVQNVQIDFLDGNGQVIRSFSGRPGDTTRPPVINSVGQDISGSIPPDPIVRVGKGLQRFSWDLRYPPATDFVGIRLRGASAAGPQAVPGEYTVRVTADGQSQTQAFLIQKDPRLTGVTQADLVVQFEFAMQIHKRYDEGQSAVVRIRTLRSEIQDRMGRGDSQVKAGGEPLVTSLTGVEGEIYQFRAEAESDLKHFGTKLTNHLSALKGYVMSSDSRPTAQSYAVFDEISADLEIQLKHLEKILNEDVADFNRLLREKNLQPVGVRPAVIS
jgi:photosystem II stability/assembly factor-like uncharacterized protein